MPEMQNKDRLISVALPGPWWTELTYRVSEAGELPLPGARVRVPVGRGTRVAVVIGWPRSAYYGEIREIAAVVDPHPILPPPLRGLLRWFGETYLCGAGTAAKTLLPTEFMAGREIDLGRQKDCPTAYCNILGCSEPEGTSDTPRGVTFAYEPEDASRLARYAEMLADGRATLVSFPLYPAAKRFYESLITSASFPDDLKKRILLFPRSGAKAEWRAWSRLLATDEFLIVIGGQSSATAPLRGLRRIVVEDESNNIWRTVRPPVCNVRSLLAKRAQLERAELVLGGRMPSSRAFVQAEKVFAAAAADDERTLGRTYFVDLRLAYAPSVKGICDTLAVSEPLVRETESVLADGRWALWILDRKGYAGEVLCEECGTSMVCGRCGGAMRWEAARGRLRCVVCAAVRMIPEHCPVCGGRLLTAKRPGLEALLPLARAAINTDVPILALGDDNEGSAVGLPDLPGSPGSSGLLLGTRAALAACDDLRVGLVGWIDADGEARSQDYDARTRAFGLMWESRWRGIEAAGRTLVLQSRRPGREWQKGLGAPCGGWRTFWRRELSERSEFGMPPFNALVRVGCTRPDAEAIAERLSTSFEYWVSEDDSARVDLWIRTLKLGELRKALAPSFRIGRTGRKGYPSVTIWHE